MDASKIVKSDAMIAAEQFGRLMKLYEILATKGYLYFTAREEVDSLRRNLYVYFSLAVKGEKSEKNEHLEAAS